MKIILDENVHRGLLSFLISLKHDVKITPTGIRNGNLFALSQSEERILITRDSDFIDERFKSTKHFGIILLRIPARDLEAQKTGISKILTSSKSFNNKTYKLISEDLFELIP